MLRIVTTIEQIVSGLSSTSVVRKRLIAQSRCRRFSAVRDSPVPQDSALLWKNVFFAAKAQNYAAFEPAYTAWKKSTVNQGEGSYGDNSKHVLLKVVGGYHVNTDGHAKILTHLLRDGACMRPTLYGIADDDDDLVEESAATPAVATGVLQKR